MELGKFEEYRDLSPGPYLESLRLQLRPTDKGLTRFEVGDFPVEMAFGDTDKIDALEKLLRQYGIKEFVRTGKVAMPRGLQAASA